MSDDRVMKVSMRADFQQAIDEFDRAGRKIRETGTEAEKLAQKQQAFQMLGRGMVAAGGLIAVGLGVAISKFADFDQAMSFVQAATHETAENMAALRQAALDAGASTVFSATEAANAVEELAKAGLSTSDILGGALTGSLDLAAAGGLGVARAAEISATALQQFGLEGSQASHVADVLAAGAGKAMGSVEDLAQGLKFVGPIAASMGVSIEETAGTLALFAQQGIIGEQAGTSLRGMLSSLTSPSSQARKEIERLGITLYDSRGNFRGLEAAAGELSTAYSGMTGEARDASLGIIFGNQQLTAATALYQAGAEGVREWTEAVDDQGYAAETAAIRLDNLTGDLEAFQGALDTAFITMGEAADGPGRFFIQMLTGLVDKFNEMPAAGQQAVFWVGTAAAAAALAGGTYLLAVPKVAAFNAAIEALGPGAQKAARNLGLVAKVGGGALAGLAVGAVAVDLLTDALRSIGPSAEVTANQIKTATDATQLFTASMEQVGGSSSIGLAEQQIKSLGDTLDNFGKANGSGGIVAANTITVLKQLGSELAVLAKSDLPSAQKQFRLLAESAGLTEQQQGLLLAQMGEYEKAITGQATLDGNAANQKTLLAYAMGTAAAGSEEAATAVDVLAEAAAVAEGNLSDMQDALRDIAGTAMGMGDAVDRAQSAVNKLGEAAKAEGASLYGLDDASIALRDSIRDVEQAHRDSAQAILENGGSLQDATTEWAKGREAVIQMRISMGESREEATKWADENVGSAGEVEQALVDVRDAVVGIPDRKTIALDVNTDMALNKLDRLVRTFNGTTLRLNVATDSFRIPGNYRGNLYEKGIPHYASGGIPSGIYAGVQGGIFAERERGVPWESFISGRAADRDRNIGIWMETGHKLGVSAATPAPLSLDGLSIVGTLDIGGDGLARIIDGRIIANANGQARVVRGRLTPT